MNRIWKVCGLLLLLGPALSLSGAGDVFNNDHLGISFTMPDGDWEKGNPFRMAPTPGWMVEFFNKKTFSFIAFSGEKNQLRNDSALDTVYSMMRTEATELWMVRKLNFSVGKLPTEAREIRYTAKSICYSGIIVAFRSGDRQFLFFFGAWDTKFGTEVDEFSKVLKSIKVK